jgi:putative ABC transport system permease protein
VLESVGMTKGGVRRTLNMESVFCSVRALAFGLPLGVLASYAAHRGLGMAAEFVYAVPWLSVLECVLGVFVITWATMRHASSRLRKGSIVDTIRGE